MMQDDRSNAQALGGLFDIGDYMRKELQKNPPPAMRQQQKPEPMSIIDQMDERHGKFSNRLSLFGHLLSGGTRADFGDADLLAAQKSSQAQQAMQDKMGMAQPYIDMMQDDDPNNNLMGMFGLSQMGFDQDMMEMAMPGMAPSDDTDIMRTTKAYVDSYNEANKDKEGFEPMTFHQGYDIVKNYDAGRRGDQAGAVATAQSDVQQYNDSRDAYITAVEQDAVLADRIDNIDKGLDMLESGSVDTGPVVGFLAETFGLGTAELAELQQMSLEEAMEALQAFKGPTTDFEFGKAELKSFAQIFKGEDMNIGTLRSARNSLEKLRRRNMLSGQSHLDSVREYGSKEQGDRLINVFAQPDYWAGYGSPSTKWDGKTTDYSGMDGSEFQGVYDQMPPGTVYTGPDGKRRTKK